MYALATTLGILVLVGVLVTLASLVALHALPTGLRPLRDPVSAYGITRYRNLYRAQTIGTAVAAVALALLVNATGLAPALPPTISLVALTLSRLVIGWVPMDAAGAARSATGRAHDLLAYAAFASASVSGFLLAIPFAHDERLSALSATSSVFGWAMTAASALTVIASVARPLGGIFGLAERLIYAGMLSWLAWAAIVILVA